MCRYGSQSLPQVYTAGMFSLYRCIHLLQALYIYIYVYMHISVHVYISTYVYDLHFSHQNMSLQTQSHIHCLREYTPDQA